MSINKDEIDTSDYKLDKNGRKTKAHRIVFNNGEDDGTKGIKEGSMKKSFNNFLEQHTLPLTEEQLDEIVAELQEVLGKDDPAGKWISDFVHSDNPKFAGKSKEKRKQMALAAYYSAKRNEAVELGESAFNWKGTARQTDTRNTGDSTRTAHTVTKTSTGTVYTKQHDEHGVSKEFKRDNDQTKRGRGRPKKDKFSEAVEFLNSLDEETFDSFMEEGFDAFMEQYEQLDEISKATLGSYIKKAGRDAVIKRKIAGDFEHQADKSRKPGMKAAATTLADKYKAKSWQRSHGVNKAVDRLTK